jgi:hypothetical protein
VGGAPALHEVRARELVGAVDGHVESAVRLVERRQLDPRLDGDLARLEGGGHAQHVQTGLDLAPERPNGVGGGAPAAEADAGAIRDGRGRALARPALGSLAVTPVHVRVVAAPRQNATPRRPGPRRIRCSRSRLRHTGSPVAGGSSRADRRAPSPYILEIA